MAPDPLATQPIKRKRGRPTAASTWLSLEAVAEALRWDVEALQRLLERAPGAIPGAIEGVNGWEVPERGLRELLGGCSPIPQMCTVEDVTTALRVRSKKTVYAWLAVPGLLPHKKVLGRVLITAQAVLALPAKMPPHARALSFFSDRPAKVPRERATREVKRG